MASATFDPIDGVLLTLYQRLADSYGPQAWWPADTPFEVAVGAVLTQNAAWSNVEKAIGNLKNAGVLELDALLELDPARLAQLIRPSGYFNVKAQRLRNLCLYIRQCGGLDWLAAQDVSEARGGLLLVNGIGPETADDILLYALDRPVFVIDTYTRRLLQRHDLAQGDEDYEVLRAGFERTLPAEVELFKQFHALIVQHAKAACGKRPRCADCRLRDNCATGMAV